VYPNYLAYGYDFGEKSSAQLDLAAICPALNLPEELGATDRNGSNNMALIGVGWVGHVLHHEIKIKVPGPSLTV